MQPLSGNTSFYEGFGKLSEIKRGFNEVNLSKGTKPKLQRVKKKEYTGLGAAC